jgi:protein involved in polysaccharide export with SLBB domain
VKRPAIYELKNKYDLMGLFDMAGGLIPNAYTQQIQISRIQKGERQIIIDINDRDLTKSKDILLKDGDMVKVFSIVDKDMNVVFLYGNVKRPGKYEYKPGMRVSDLISNSADLLKETHFEYALIKRLNPPGLETQLVPFNLSKLLSKKDGTHNILLKPQDVVNVFSIWMFKDKPYISIEGEVRKAGKYELLDSQRVKDAILGAGGLAEDASRGKSEIFRTNEDGDISQIFFNVGLAMAKDEKENILLQKMDKIKIHSIWEDRQRQTVSIEGDVKNPGEYPLASNMRISDLVFSAGNVLESAYLDEAEVSSFIITDGKSMEVSNRDINLKSALKDDPEHDILLKPYDRVFVRRIPEWKEKRFVSLSGEVTFPGKYITGKGERLSSVLERAGGYSSNAYLRGSVFTRQNVRELQQKSLDDMILRLERELLADGSIHVSSSVSHEELVAKQAGLQQRQKFIESLKTLKATGRMSINLTHLRLLKGSKYDIELEDNDSIYIPMKNSVINVVGAVMSRGSFIYSGKMDYKDYISMTGGYTRFADKNNVYVLKVDGTARKLSNGFFEWNISGNRWELTAFGEKIKDLEPGDTIVVPEKFERIAWLREIKDITQILYQIAIATGVTIALF